MSAYGGTGSLFPSCQPEKCSWNTSKANWHMFKYLPNENTAYGFSHKLRLTFSEKAAYQKLAAQYGLPTDETQIDANDILYEGGVRPLLGWSLRPSMVNRRQHIGCLWPSSTMSEAPSSHTARSIQQCQPVHSLTNCVGSWRNDGKIRCESKNLMKSLICKLDKANQRSLKSLSCKGKLEDARHANSNVAVEMANVQKTIKITRFFSLLKGPCGWKAKATLDVSRGRIEAALQPKKQPFKKPKIC